MSKKSAFFLAGIIIIIILIISAGVFYYTKNQNNKTALRQPNKKQSSDNIEVVTSDVDEPASLSSDLDTSDWKEYVNIALGYKVKLPPDFYSYSEAYNQRIDLDSNNKFLVLHDQSGQSTRVWIYEKILSDMLSENDFLAELHDNYKANQVDINDHTFLRYYFNSNGSYGETYEVKNKRDAIIFILFIKGNKDDFDYIKKGILSTFELIDN